MTEAAASRLPTAFGISSFLSLPSHSNLSVGRNRMSAPEILISAGEASSDMYAARLATALRARTGARFLEWAGREWLRPALS